MIQAAERTKVQFLVWWQWKRSDRRLLQSLRLFENTEDDSAWQLLRASEEISEAHLKAELFAQIMEETFHAEEFRRVYKELSHEPMNKISFEKKALFHGPKAYQIFAYCLIGEDSAAKRFQNIAASLEPGPLKSMLERVVSDEVGHIHKARELLGWLSLSPLELKKQLFRIRLERGYEHWLRLGRKITDLLSEGLLSLLYYSVAGIFSWILVKQGNRQ